MLLNITFEFGIQLAATALIGFVALVSALLSQLRMLWSIVSAASPCQRKRFGYQLHLSGSQLE